MSLYEVNFLIIFKAYIINYRINKKVLISSVFDIELIINSINNLMKILSENKKMYNFILIELNTSVLKFF